MNQSERRQYLIRELLGEDPRFAGICIPGNVDEQKQLLRALMNVRMPKEISREFLMVQDAYLTVSAKEKGVVELSDLTPVQPGIYLWKGDITRLKVDAIVNAANSEMTGCYHPNHGCIDNCIHTYAGVQLRLKCAKIMEQQGTLEPAGQAKITPGYNLPARYVIHTVGPIVNGRVTERDEDLLASCYLSSLKLAREKGLRNIAFCCISTGVFHFPNDRAAKIAVQTVKEYTEKERYDIEVIFNVFKEIDEDIYKRLLKTGSSAERRD